MCSIKTLIKIALGMGLLLIVGYVIFPQAHAWIVAATPYLLFLACPLAMYLMTKGMNTPQKKGKETRSGWQVIGRADDASIRFTRKTS